MKRGSPQLQNSGSKRPRPIALHPPSRVLHGRNVSPDATKLDFDRLASSANAPRQITKVLVMRKSGQALIEFATETAASMFLAYYGGHNRAHAIVRGQAIHFSYSHHRQLVDGSGSSESGRAPGPNAFANGHMKGTAVCPILIVSVSNLVYPLNIETIQKIFRPYGTLLRVVSFYRNQELKILVEFASAAQATAAIAGLDGKNVYTGCNTLSLNYSKRHQLIVHATDDFNWDFTKMPYPGPAVSPALPNAGGDRGHFPADRVHSQVPPGHMCGTASPVESPGFRASFSSGSSMSMSHSHSRSRSPSHSRSDVGFAGSISAGAEAGGSVLIVSGLPTVGGETRGGERVPNFTCDQLFSLFGVYGNVERVKILYGKRDTALVQYTNAIGADAGKQHLNGAAWAGSTVRVNFSKHAVITGTPSSVEYAANDFQPGASSSTVPGSSSSHKIMLMQDFPRCFQRYHEPFGSGAHSAKLMRNMTPPTATLHLSRIPEDKREVPILQKACADLGLAPRKIHLFPRDSRMALVEFDNPQAGLQALVTLHNFPYSRADAKYYDNSRGNKGIQATFTKSTIV
jgi:hnRNP-L/PTB/hephaestus splicing factor